MHYHGIVQGLIDQAQQQLRRHNAVSVLKVYLKIGDKIDRDHFLDDLAVFSQGTVLEGTEIAILGSIEGSEIVLERIELDDGQPTQ